MQTSDQAAPEAAHHAATLEALARETATEPAKVQELYEREVADLEATATVKGFISVLASRNVRAALRRRRHY
jgi:hypothetical protein